MKMPKNAKVVPRKQEAPKVHGGRLVPEEVHKSSAKADQEPSSTVVSPARAKAVW